MSLWSQTHERGCDLCVILIHGYRTAVDEHVDAHKYTANGIKMNHFHRNELQFISSYISYVERTPAHQQPETAIFLNP